MALPKNSTHIHLTRSMAREAAENVGLDLDDLHFYRPEGGSLWGWMKAEDAETMNAADAALPVDEVVESNEQAGRVLVRDHDEQREGRLIRRDVENIYDPAIHDIAASPQAEQEEPTGSEDDDDMSMDAIMARNAARNRELAPPAPVQATDEDGFYDIALDPNLSVETPIATPVLPVSDEQTIDGHCVDVSEDEPKSLVALTNDTLENDPDRKAEPGDLVLMIGGPMLPARAMLDAQAFAKKLGVKILMRDAMTMEVVNEVMPRVRGERAAKGPGRVGPSDLQWKLIDLCTRVDGLGMPIGATSQELFAAGAGGNAKKNTIAWRQLALGCERHGYKLSIGSRIENDRVLTVYILTKTDDHANDDTRHAAAAE